MPFPPFIDSSLGRDGGPASGFGDDADSPGRPRTTPIPPEVARNPALVRVGECIAHIVRFSREDVSRFAAMTLDRNPVHHDVRAARRAGQADVIASGQHTTGVMSGLAASHFTRGSDGIAREMLCLHFNYACKAPVPAEREVRLLWEVRDVEWNETLDGYIAQLAGEARVDGVAAVVARGTVLVKAARDLEAPVRRALL